MTPLQIVMDMTDTPDGKPVISKDAIHGNLTTIGALPGGMASGKPSVTVVMQLDDGQEAYGETSLTLLQTAAKALTARYEGEQYDPEEQAGKTLGQIAFEAYSHERGGKNHDGTPTPPWDALGKGVQDGWWAAAAAIIVHKGLGLHSE